MKTSQNLRKLRVNQVSTKTMIAFRKLERAITEVKSNTEIATNVVNQCGRTLLAGNIDVGATTEDALAANQVTQVTKGSTVKVTIRQVNETGAGPYTCDMDLTGNTAGTTGQINVTTTESDPNNKGEITLKVAMPDDLACIGCECINKCNIAFPT